MKSKRCNNPSCATRGFEVKTNRATCLLCDESLQDLSLTDFFGMDDLFNPFGVRGSA